MCRTCKEGGERIFLGLLDAQLSPCGWQHYSMTKRSFPGEREQKRKRAGPMQPCSRQPPLSWKKIQVSIMRRFILTPPVQATLDK